MPNPVVEAKLILPRVRAGAVARHRLDQMLARGEDATLVLISAPPGFGKTTLVANWLRAGPRAGSATAWVSLDEGDRTASSFWTYVLVALERASPGSAAGALSLLQSGQATIEVVLATLLNELSVLPDDVHLVMDDYHLADGPDIRAGMTFLLEHLPPQVHVVISTRADPALPLARLRARGELVEVRASDLRFSGEEAAVYLNDVAGLGLGPSEVERLQGRTEGWVAALQLAALSLHGRQDAAGFIAGFAGDDRHVVDYLAVEVLDRQPDRVRKFLLETSILKRLTAPLCDAVTGQTGGKAMLEALDRDNLFVVPLDDQRRWYRYHHLFGDVLASHLLDERSGDLSELHRRASAWYAETGDPVSAVDHALAAGDVDRAADLVERSVRALTRARRESVIRSWMDEVPAEVVRDRPVLALAFIGVMAAGNEFDGIEARLRELEQMLLRPVAELSVLDPRELERVPGSVQTYWAALALAAGDLTGTRTHADLAIARAADGDDLTVAAGSALAGLAAWAGGDLEAAHVRYTAAIAGLERAGHIADVLGCTIALADLDLTQGRLDEAQHDFERALALAAREGPGLRGTADMHVGLSRVAWEQGDLVAAAEQLRRADALGESASLAQNPYRWRVALAHIREAEGNWVTALDLVDEAIRLYVGDYSPDVRPVHALRARMLAAHGDVEQALDWARQHELSAGDDLSYAREYEHVTLARVLLAQHTRTGSVSVLTEAMGLLERLGTAAGEGGRIGTLIEVLVLHAIGLATRTTPEEPEPADALARLERALTLAEPGGWHQVFLGEGAVLVRLLGSVARGRPDWRFLQKIVESSTSNVVDDGPAVSVDGAVTGVESAGLRLVDPLSERELDVLRLLASDLDGPGIARELVVSLNTVRTHTKHIYTKLGVNSRRAAVRQAHQLNLLARRR
jgi:LuxR family transcriptional regulator, maltose regulon positive regulatory protein